MISSVKARGVLLLCAHLVSAVVVRVHSLQNVTLRNTMNVAIQKVLNSLLFAPRVKAVPAPRMAFHSVLINLKHADFVSHHTRTPASLICATRTRQTCASRLQTPSLAKKHMAR